MRRVGPARLLRFDEGWPLAPGLALIVLLVGAYLQMISLIVVAVVHLNDASLPHLYLNGILTPMALLAALAWVALALAGWVAADSGYGFSLCGLALAARAQCEVTAWSTASAMRLSGIEPLSPSLLNGVRHAATVAYVAGLALVVAASLASRKARRSAGPRTTARVIVAAVTLLLVAGGGTVVYLGARRVLGR